MIKILFVCMGNICRSPTAEGVFRALVNQEGIAGIECDSAGTIGYHVGEPPDRRAQETARSRGVDLSAQRSRKLADDDYQTFHYIMAMDSANLRDIEGRAPANNKITIARLLDFAPQMGIKDVPDPYYGGADGFEKVFDMIEIASKGFLDHIKKNHF